ncbi:putative ABC transport system permease protein [Pseudochelatococcus lubricantis]|uniref:ABC transport system permease protein n=1 Tax=Pseudochelatococcus lubricantis TaxID=1538102 RepID=A0ABX0V0S7_9HYPH|nr:ABC transporter permease [Pseudochelatococcus lubricantis]NIJ57699.1 putative ABC transport system permease protein [Pseudochelatococcus lubricantis]
MSSIALLGAIELGLIYALVGLGVYLSFRVLDFPDLTVDGSFPLGAAVTAVLLVAGADPWVATGAGVVAGALAGFVTAFVTVRFGVLHLLASILTMIALFSVNLRIMGRPNIALLTEATVLTPWLSGGTFGGLVADEYVRPLFLAVVVLAAVALVAAFLRSEAGLAMRATGANPRMARAQGVRTGVQIIVGVMLSNGLVGLAGALFAQTNGFADVTSGVGTIVVGLAAVIVGETFIPRRRIFWALVGCVVGAVIYRLAVQTALSIDFLGLQASDLNLATALLVLVALVLPKLRHRVRTRAAS